NAYSYSAIGHKGLVETLRALDVPVVVSEHEPAAKAAGGGVLVIAEPVISDRDGARAAALRAMLIEADRALLVLPKWYGRPATLQPTWIDDAGLLLTSEVELAARVAGVAGAVVRPEAVAPVQTRLGF